MTCGMQRMEYGSCTRPQCGCEGSIWLPSSRARTAAATAICLAGRARRVDARIERFDRALMASSERAGHQRGTEHVLGAEHPASASAVDTCVPLSSASPSLGPSTKGCRPGGHGLAARHHLPSTVAWPSPISTQARCASGARSPEAPTEPLAGMTGSTLALASASSASTMAGGCPSGARQAHGLVASTRRTTPSGSASPVPTPVRKHQVALQLGQALVGDLRAGQLAEAGVDAVDHLVFLNDALYRGQRGLHASLRRGSSVSCTPPAWMRAAAPA